MLYYNYKKKGEIKMLIKYESDNLYKYEEVKTGEVFQEVDDKSINLMCEDQTAVNLETGEFWTWGEDENLHSGVRLLKAKMVIG